VPACVFCNLVPLTVLDNETSSFRYLIIKVCHLPAHLLLIISFVGSFNPFLIFFMWVPVVAGIALLILSGCNDIGACISLWRRDKCSIKKAAFFCLSGFVIILTCGWRMYAA
ncbi:MAG: hypothetical protein II589_01685, partial [Clostridia bacterium]|nr:hypothetical protein [Clostridia bacterium]